MAVRGQKAKNTKAKGTKGNPTRTKVKTPNLNPRQVSMYKNDATKATSKAILQVERITGTGPRSTIGSLKISTSSGKLGKKYEAPKIKATATKAGSLRSTLRVIKRVKKYNG